MSRAKTTIVAVVSAITVITASYVYYWWTNRAGSEETDNAYVSGDITSIGPKVAGYVTTLAVDDNQVVQVGDILARIDDADFRAHVDRAKAAVAMTSAAEKNLVQRKSHQLALITTADANVRSAQADFDLTTRDLDRSDRLASNGWVSKSSKDSAQAAAARADAALASAKANAMAARLQLAVIESEMAQIIARRHEAQANLRLAEISLSETIIRAPVSGIVGNRHVRLGEYVRPGAVLMSVVPVRDVWVIANFKETQLENITVGQKVEVKLDGYPHFTVEGSVDSLSPGSGASFSLLPPDNATGNFVKIVQRVPVKITLSPGHPLVGRLVPGLSAEVKVLIRRPAKSSFSTSASQISPIFKRGG
ncbi:HlyD family secretion protein [Ensifer sp. ENS03]|nr:HlyD family secretion protein [Ensifer sp. ENS03]OWZ90502.1 multidrug transporter [Sinorhizobium sp. LM21]